ncbi:hypothetical protein A3740_07965 [Oleiphilus sp. HI0068]|uniref:YhdP family protein n=7 Tax=Oleiphilus TaxID=141450 RepID=UPI0007C28EDB|nr:MULTISPECIES: YhdP family protein [unclassified Oleiphilus]KZY78313.1 hypothetical protein A3740_07965 [Oleiphilus sp. HI0068]KZY86772.1 hypothetical protein A3741_14075 [Oleiphilus sp. HI0069]KZY31132.1 hypothetical protein A3729_09755 [Oleiphilus sp. HI0043]KZY52382.1 hypothetical protein A3735_00815 [Oleiphilus sp. HI0061]KZZ63997.1 hypothetical protein A3763_06080 [Oleiphilus sp. HI0128]
MKNKILKIIRIKLITIAFSVLFLVALYVLGLRIASIFLEDYRPDLERYLSELSGQRVEIRQLNSAWRGLDPTLNIHGLSVNGQSYAYVGRIRIQASFLNSLLNLQPSIKEIMIEHTELSMQQFEDGAWSVASTPVDLKELLQQQEKATPTALPIDIEALLGQAKIYLNDLSLSLHNNKGLVQTLRIPNSSLTYHDDSVFISGSIRESDSASSLLSFSLEGKGVLTESRMKTSLYIEARSAEFFGKLLQVYSWESLSIDDISASTRAWLEFEGFSLTSIQGNLQLNEMNWRAGEQSVPPIRNLAFDYHWQKSNQGQNMSVYGLNFSWKGSLCQSDVININSDASQTKVSMSELDIYCLAQLGLASGLLSDNLHDRLEISQPEGQLKNAWINIEHQKDASSFTFEAELDQVSLDAYEGTPSGMGINGYVFADNQGGFVNFSSHDFELGFPELFLEPWTMAKADGYVAWDIQEDGVDVYSDGLRLVQQDGGLVYGDFSIRLNGEGDEDYLDLAIALQDLSAPSAPSFVPYYIVGSGLHDWLVDALRSGTVVSGVYLGHGSVETITADNSFTSSIDLNTENLVLDFDRNWPPAEQLNANISLQNGQLLVIAPEAKIVDTKLNEVRATMLEPEGAASSILRIESSTKATSENLQYWLAESPISEHTEAVAEQLVFEGDFDVDVLLDIPVSEGDDGAELAYLIRSTLEGVKLHHPDSGISFDRVTGVLDVTEDKGVTANDVEVIAFGKPALLNISTSFDPATYDYLLTDLESNEFRDLSQTNISLAGNTDIEQVFDFFGYQTTAFLGGSFDYLAELYLPNHKESEPFVDIRSNLKGLTRDWPWPLAKHVDQREDFITRLKLKPSQMLVLSKLNLDNSQALNTELLFVDGKFSFGEVSINKASMEAPDLSGLNIAANLNELDADSWIDFVGDLIALPWELDSDNNTESILKKVQLDVASTTAFDHKLKQARIEISQPSDEWQVELRGEDISGKIVLPNTDGSIKADFSKLVLSSDTPSSDLKEDSAPIDPRTLSNVEFSASNLQLDGRKLGAWSGNLQSSPTGAIFSNIKGSVKGSQFSGRLNWQVSEDNLQTSILTMDGKGRHFENVFRLAGIDPLVSSDDFSSKLALTWPGAPKDFSLGKLSGSLSLILEDGFLQTDDEKTGALRLFGILNAEAIMRRLKLDFSDLYKSGVGFDSFTMNSSIDQGLLTLSKPLVIDGPAGKYTINGSSDLASKALDLDMLIELPFSQNVPLAALVLGAPQIGGLVWLADKLLGEPLSALTTSRYDITGTWQKPIVELKEAVNASKKKRKTTQTPQRVTPPIEESDAGAESNLAPN